MAKTPNPIRTWKYHCFKNITEINGKYFFYKTSLINETIYFCLNEECNKEKKMENFQINLFK